MMKRVIFTIAILAVMATMVSFGSNAKGVATVPAELWTEEAVETQIRKMYDRLNDMDKNGVINIVALENEFCSSYYLNLRNAIHKAIKDASGDDLMFFGDEEGYRFLAGMPTPLEIEKIKVDLLTGDMAQAQVRFKGADEENGFMRLELDFENGAWRVKNFDQPEAFGPGGILKIMEDFAREHGINYEGALSAVILAQEEMIGLIKELYAAEAKNEIGIDQLYACHVWREMVAAVEEKDSHVAEIGFFNENYWTQMQDSNPDDLEARDIQFEQLDVEKGTATVSFLLHSSVQDVRQKFEFCHEDGNWRVHNIIRYFQDADGKEKESNLMEGMRSYLNAPMEEI